MENENKPQTVESQPKSQTSAEKIGAARFTPLERGILGVVAGAAIATSVNMADIATTPEDILKEINSPKKIEQKGSMPSQNLEFTPKVLNSKGYFEQGAPKSIDEIKTVLPLTPEEQQKADAIKKAEKVKAEMELKAGVRKYKEETGK